MPNKKYDAYYIFFLFKKQIGRGKDRKRRGECVRERDRYK